MILDTGIAEIYRMVPGLDEMRKATMVPELVSTCWYGELSFESGPMQHTAGSEEVEIVQRIRILQDRSLKEKYRVKLGDQELSVRRLYHGRDDDSGEPITDISLEEVIP